MNSDVAFWVLPTLITGGALHGIWTSWWLKRHGCARCFCAWTRIPLCAWCGDEPASKKGGYQICYPCWNDARKAGEKP